MRALELEFDVIIFFEGGVQCLKESTNSLCEVVVESLMGTEQPFI